MTAEDVEEAEGRPAPFKGKGEAADGSGGAAAAAPKKGGKKKKKKKAGAAAMDAAGAAAADDAPAEGEGERPETHLPSFHLAPGLHWGAEQRPVRVGIHITRLQMVRARSQHWLLTSMQACRRGSCSGAQEEEKEEKGKSGAG